MSIRQLRTFHRRLCGLALLAWPWAGWTQVPLGLDQVLDAALANIEVSIRQRLLDAAQADVVSADRSPLPVLSARTSSIDLQNGIGGGNMWRDKRIDKGVGLDYTMERGNKRDLRTRTAQSSVQAAEQDLAQTRRQQGVLASTAYFEWLAQIERLHHLQSIAVASRQQAQAAEKRHQAGDLSRQEMMRWQIEARRAEADVPAAMAGLQRATQILRQVTRLNTPTEGWRPAQGWPEAGGERVRLEALAPQGSRWVEQRPDVIAAQARADAARHALELAQSLKKSDITWGASMDHYPGTSNRLLELRMQMPLQWNYSYQGEIARAQAQALQSQDQLEQTRLQAQTELHGLTQDFVAARARWQAHRDEIGPKARQVLEQAEQAYQKGALSLTDLIDARRTHHQTWLEGLAARLEHAVAYASLLWQAQTETQARQQLVSHASPPGAPENKP
jgi:cobalt-zinc-cadmium efflux system outer membrane protein